MDLVLKTAPTTYPVSLQDVRTHLRIDSNDEDAYLRDLIAAATALCESMTARRFIEQTWTFYLPSFPAGEILLPYPPLKTIGSVKYYDESNVEQTLAVGKYQVNGESPAALCPAPNESWPGTYPSRLRAVAIEFVCGWANAAAVPVEIKHAMKLLIGHWYEHREMFSEVGLTEVPHTVDTLLLSQRGSWGLD